VMVTPECLLRIVSRRGVEVLAYGSMTSVAADVAVANSTSSTNTTSSTRSNSEQHRICRNAREMENGIY